MRLCIKSTYTIQYIEECWHFLLRLVLLGEISPSKWMQAEEKKTAVRSILYGCSKIHKIECLCLLFLRSRISGNWKNNSKNLCSIACMHLRKKHFY